MKLIPILLDIRSAHNVGSILRSADCFGLNEVWCVGITPYPVIDTDGRLPHIARSAHAKIAKTALGSELTVNVRYFEDFDAAHTAIRTDDSLLYGLEQSDASIALDDVGTILANSTRSRLGLVLGNEPEGISPEIIGRLDGTIEIRQFGSKESLNVSVAAGIAFFAMTMQ